MCVICYIPKNKNLPNKKDLKNMWNYNPDGAGIMWLQDNKVYISKGYFDFDDLYRDILIVKKDYNFECAIHFRWATHGSINRELCHPFPISNNSEEILKTRLICDVGIMHNGIIRIDNRKEFSDTAEYVISELYPKYEKDKDFFLHMTENSERKMLSRISNSRLLFFSKNGIKMIGKWENFKGCYCSNLIFNNY